MNDTWFKKDLEKIYCAHSIAAFVDERKEAGFLLKDLNLNINLPKEKLISAARICIGKYQNYWMDLNHKGASEIFNLEKELLPFLDNPKNHLRK